MEFRANSIAQAVGFKGSEAGGPVRIATMEGLGSFYLSPRLQLFYERHPSVLIELETSFKGQKRILKRSLIGGLWLRVILHRSIY